MAANAFQVLVPQSLALQVLLSKISIAFLYPWAPTVLREALSQNHAMLELTLILREPQNVQFAPLATTVSRVKTSQQNAHLVPTTQKLVVYTNLSASHAQLDMLAQTQP